MKLAELGLEAISHQDGSFAEFVSDRFTTILSKANTAREAESHPALMEIIEATYKVTGVKIDIKMDTKMGLCCLPECVNFGHIFNRFNVPFGNEASSHLAMMKSFKKESFVDLKEAKVGGYFSEIRSPIYLSYNDAKATKLTGKELAAVFAHELGHLFTYYEFFARCVITNQALAYTMKCLNDSNGDATSSKYIYKIKELGKEVANDDNYFQELVGIKDGNVVSTVVIGNTFKKNPFYSGTSVYDKNSSEFLADDFATRMGFGKELVTSLAKLHKYSFYPEYQPTLVVLFARFLAFVAEVSIVGLIAAGITAASLSTAMVISLCTSVVMGILFGGELSRDYTYDEVKVRYLRIKESLTTKLKEPKLPDDLKKETIDAISVIEDNISVLNNPPEIFRMISNFILSGNRREKSGIVLQRQLETLAANDLFTKAAQMSLVGAK